MPDGITTSFTDAVSGPEMMANLREIARWVKSSGTAEEREALAFVERRMRDYGFRTNVILHDAFISLPGKASVLVDGKPVKAITQSFSLSSPVSGVSGVPVYVGHGTEEDFAGRDLAGRILLMEGMATPATAKRATEAGAIAHLHISHHEHIHEMCISPVWGSPGNSTKDGMPRTVVCSVDHADGGAIRDALAAGKSPVVTLHAEVDTGWRKTPILVAEIDGPAGGGDEPFVLLSGHHDTWYYGVMDNGSANAGMLEVARLCAERRDRMRRGLRVCFWSGHSHGRYSSSAWYADAYWDELDRRCVAHVNVDSLGGAGATVLANTAAMAELWQLAASAVQAHTNQTYKGKRKNRSSDDSFVGIGIPSMFGSISEQPAKHAQARNALGWWWHTPHDTIDKVDEANLVRDTRVLGQVVWNLVGSEVVPLDHAATAASLLAELAPLEGRLAGRFPVEPLVAAATALRDEAAALAGRPAKDAAAANAALMRASRALVPADYTAGDRFLHPHALPVPNWPTLQPIRDLAATAAGTDEERYAAVDALRARNRVAFALREARAAIADAAAALG
jgi:hypothetical protein